MLPLRYDVIYIYIYLLHDAQDIECKYGVLECKYTAILHGSTTDTAVQLSSDISYTFLLTAERRINGGTQNKRWKAHSFLDLFAQSYINNLLHR